MPSGLAALLDDIALIAKLAASSVDDVAAAAGKAGAKAAGVVIDDTAVTPQYVTGFTPDRELPIIWRIAKGSVRNKVLLIMPAALLLGAFLPAAITPLLMLGGAYLCFEGAEKVLELLARLRGAAAESVTQEVAKLSSAEHEATMVKGAVRTDFILSAEIMAIALNEVSGESIALQAGSLFAVAIGITAAVYGVVGLLVKMDDVGLRLARRGGGASKALGRALVTGMPKLFTLLSTIGTAAMLWVGGQIILHGLHVYPAKRLGITGGLVGWLADALLCGVFGLVLGAVIVWIHHRVAGARAH